MLRIGVMVSGGGTNLQAILDALDAGRITNAQIDVVSAGQVVRKFTIPNAFVMGYEEDMDDETGVGTFSLHIKQKKDENNAVKIEGGYGE